MLSTIEKILALSKKRINYLHNIDDRGGFYKGDKTYIQGIIDELEEVKDEIRENNSVYLEDELGDVFRNVICVIHSMEEEGLINREGVFNSCYRKLSERIGPNADGGADWNEVKKIQKERLKKEHNLKYNKEKGNL